MQRELLDVGAQQLQVVCVRQATAVSSVTFPLGAVTGLARDREVRFGAARGSF
jgi:hypothetical protein